MKTVTGKLVLTKPISLSNAAKYLSRFASSDNGVSTEVAVYLQRTCDAFNGLVQFHKKLKGSHSSREAEQVSKPTGIDARIEPSADGAVQEKKNKKSGKKADEKVFDTVGEEIKQEVLEVEGDMKKEKKKKRKKGEVGEAERNFGGGEGKKRKSREVDGGETIDSAEQTGKKKKKRRRIEGDGK